MGSSGLTKLYYNKALLLINTSKKLSIITDLFIYFFYLKEVYVFACAKHISLGFSARFAIYEKRLEKDNYIVRERLNGRMIVVKNVGSKSN